MKRFLQPISGIATWLIVLATLSSAFYPLPIANERTGFRKEYRMLLIQQWFKQAQR